MKLVTFGHRGAEQPGVLVDEERILPILPVLANAGIFITEVPQILAVWSSVHPLIATARQAKGDLIAVASVRLGAPVPRPGKVIAIGFNYRKTTEAVDSAPVVFLKPPTAVSGPFDPIVIPAASEQTDWEVELAVVIGKAGARINAAQAWDHIAGYAVANDVTARDIAYGAGLNFPMHLQIARAKGYETFCPLGPWLVTRDEVPDGTRFELELSVNGERRQKASTDDMLTGIPELIASVSASMRLLPGDILLTGTPAGCGFQLDPPAFLRHGDTVRASITGLGEMCTPVAEEGALPQRGG